MSTSSTYTGEESGETVQGGQGDAAVRGRRGQQRVVDCRRPTGRSGAEGHRPATVSALITAFWNSWPAAVGEPAGTRWPASRQMAAASAW
jgi:hypothetical protein